MSLQLLRWLPLVLSLAACTTRPSQLERLARFTGADSSVFQVEYSELDEELIPSLSSALQGASEQVQRWGGLSRPVRLLVHPDHASLELAIGRPGFPWLRAWAQYRTIHLQSPRTWGIPYEGQLEELLSHELTHVAMYQAVGGPEDWERREVPLWFREGMASVSAGQGYRRGNEPDIAVFLSRERIDPFAADEEVLRLHKDLVYSCSHWAFLFLLRQHGGGEEEGTARVRRLLQQLREGIPFDRAFRDSWGMSEQEFLRRWQRHIGVQVPRS